MRKSADLASPGCQCRAVTYAPLATPKWPPGNSRLPSKAPTRQQFHRRGQTSFVTPLVMNAVTVTFTLRPKNSRCCYLFVVVEFLHSNPQQTQWLADDFLTPSAHERERRNVIALLALSLSLGVGAAHFI